MKLIAFNGSARLNGNTAIMIETVLNEVKAEGIECEVINLCQKKVRGCTACGKCYENKDLKCVVNDDLNFCFQKMLEADAVLLGSPTYFTDVSTEMKALIDRAGYLAKANREVLKYKVGAAVVAVRRGGAIHAFDTMNHFFLISQMIVPGSSYWNDGFGREKGEVSADAEGKQTMVNLGRNMAWLLKKINGK
ncbi:MAG TPA: flavodoxin family protein [Candidatus Wallbacteria bacterium]|nr:flavodoxin family protein [Candidatus Wallbacteria bacterium]HPG58264.1 flavodoxin family protein [Candidatus Wallbacteria bacterium]